MNDPKKTVDYRLQQIAGLREEGLSFATIGMMLGISGERVRQIFIGKANQRSEKSRTNSTLRTSEVARLLNVHPNTVRQWTKKGFLKAYRLGPRGDRRFNRKQIESMLMLINLDL